MNNLIIAILDLLDGDKPKKELLTLAKQIQRLKENAKIQAREMAEDAKDEFALDFGEKLFQLLEK